MAWDLRGNMDDEIERGLMSASPDARREIAELFPPYPYDRHRPIVDQGAVVDGVFEQDATTRRHPQAVPAAAATAAQRRAAGAASTGRSRGCRRCSAASGDGIGSNGWVVDGDHSTTGKPILANDPHLRRLGARASGTRWACTARRLGADCPFDVSGFTFSGLPGRGHRPQPADRLGLHEPRPRRHRPLPREGAGQDLPVRRQAPPAARCATRRSRSLGRSKPFRFTVRSTRHGPLLSDVSTQLSTRRRERARRRRTRRRAATATPSRSRGPRSRPSNTADAIFEFDRATDWQQFRAAAADFAVPVAEPRLRRPGRQHRLPGAGPDPDPQVRQQRRLPGAGLAAGRRLDREVRPVRRAAERAEPARTGSSRPPTRP